MREVGWTRADVCHLARWCWLVMPGRAKMDGECRSDCSEKRNRSSLSACVIVDACSYRPAPAGMLPERSTAACRTA